MKYANKMVLMPFKKHLQTPKMEYLADLDKEMSNIINSKMSADEKVKLYNSSLSKYLTYSEEFEAPLTSDNKEQIRLKKEPMKQEYDEDSRPQLDKSLSGRLKDKSDQTRILSNTQSQINNIISMLKNQDQALQKLSSDLRNSTYSLPNQDPQSMINQLPVIRNRALELVKRNEIMPTKLRSGVNKNQYNGKQRSQSVSASQSIKPKQTRAQKKTQKQSPLADTDAETDNNDPVKPKPTRAQIKKQKGLAEANLESDDSFEQSPMRPFNRNLDDAMLNTSNMTEDLSFMSQMGSSWITRKYFK